MLLQIDDTYVPISNIVALKRNSGNYTVTFWSPHPNGDPFLRTVIISGEALYELESWLAGQITVKLTEVAETQFAGSGMASAENRHPPSAAG